MGNNAHIIILTKRSTLLHWMISSNIETHHVFFLLGCGGAGGNRRGWEERLEVGHGNCYLTAGMRQPQASAHHVALEIGFGYKTIGPEPFVHLDEARHL